METMERPYKEALKSLKQAIKEDSTKIKTIKVGLRLPHDSNSWSAQTKLSQERMDTRCRLLLYGFLRGHDVSYTEKNHEEVPEFLMFYLRTIFRTLEVEPNELCLRRIKGL